jgi:predicted nuclease of predicted toxin-antitoxin system
MKFLVDASLPRSTAQRISQRGHAAVDVRDVGLGTADDADIAAFARAQGFCLITADFHFADVRQYPPAEYAGLVVVERPHNASVVVTLRLIESLLEQPEVIAQLSGHLAIVDAWHIRMR